MQPNTLSDRELITRYMHGEEQAFTALLNRHKSRVYTSIYLIVKDPAIADDIFQETFIKVIDTLHSGRYNEEGKFINWTMRVAYNLAIDYYRRSKRIPSNPHEKDGLDMLSDMPLSVESREVAMIRQQTHQEVRQLLDLIPPDMKEVVILRHYAGLSFKEIAELTGVSVSTALGRMRYALIYLRKLMHEKHAHLR